MNEPVPLPVLDASRLQEITQDDADFLQELIELFIQDSARNVTQIAEAVTDGDRERLRREAHRLKGSAANMGAERLRGVARELETGSAALDFTELNRLTTMLRDELAASHAALEVLKTSGS